MRLTNEQRRRMVRDIMADVPKTDYAARLEKRLTDLALWKLPPTVLAIWSNPKTRGLLKTHSFYIRRNQDHGQYGVIASVSLPGYVDEHEQFVSDPEVIELAEKLRAALDERDRIEAELRLTLGTVKTDVELVDRLPELRKYLPEHAEAKVANLPATTALIDSLKAAGLELDKAA